MKKFNFKIVLILFFAVISIFSFFPSKASADWMEQSGSGSRDWFMISSSSDGSILIAATGGPSNNGYLYVSTNSGVTWTEQTSNPGQHHWRGVASSSDGTKLAATVYGGYVYTAVYNPSTHLYDWTEQTGSGLRNWYSIAFASGNSDKLVAGAVNDYIYISDNGGVDWTPTNSASLKWPSVASSADGQKLIAVEYFGTPGYVYVSNDRGLNWNFNNDAGSHSKWWSVASSADGSVLAAVNYDPGYIMVYFGGAWHEQSGPGQQTWNSVTVSADGTKLAAVVNGGYVYTAIYNANTSQYDWTEQTSLGSKNWYAITSSADGTKLAATVANGKIWTYVPGNGSISITSPVSYRVFQRGNNNKANIAITGSYLGNPTEIEASWNGGNYVTLAHNAGTFSGTLLDQEAGQGDLVVRFSNNHSISTTKQYVGIGDIFIIAGQSNADGLTEYLQSYSSPTGNPNLKAVMFGNDDVWKELADPVDGAINQIDAVSAVDRSISNQGSIWPLVATHFLENSNGVPVAFVPCSMGGTQIYQWQKDYINPGDINLYNSMERRINAVGGAKAVLFWQGEYDARWGVSNATYKSLLYAMVNNIKSDFNLKTVVAEIGEEKQAPFSSYLNNIRLAQVQSWSENVNILPGPSLYDVYLNWDQVHFHYNSEVQIAADRWWAALEQDFYNGANGRGPILVGVEENQNRNQITLTFQSNSFPLLPPDTGLDKTVFRVTNNNVPVTISSIAIVSPSKILVTLATALTGTMNISLGYGDTAALAAGSTGVHNKDLNNPNIGASDIGVPESQGGNFGTRTVVPTDSSIYHLPLELFIDQALLTPPINSAPVAISVTITGTTQIGNTLTGHYGYSDTDGDTEGTSTFRWLRDGIAIVGATGITYDLVSADVGKTIKFEVTPIAQTGTIVGTARESSGVIISEAPIVVPISNNDHSHISGYFQCLPGYVFNPNIKIGKPCSLIIPTIIPTVTPVVSPFTRTIKLGIYGDDVKALQTYLNSHGYPLALTGPCSKGNESTKFGLLTFRAVKAFQKDHGLKVDGVVGPQTIKFLI